MGNGDSFPGGTVFTEDGGFGVAGGSEGGVWSAAAGGPVGAGALASSGGGASEGAVVGLGVAGNDCGGRVADGASGISWGDLLGFCWAKTIQEPVIKSATAPQRMHSRLRTTRHLPFRQAGSFI